MKIMVYEARADEMGDLRAQAERWGVEISTTDQVPSLDTASLAEGCQGVSVLGQGVLGASAERILRPGGAVSLHPYRRL